MPHSLRGLLQGNGHPFEIDEAEVESLAHFMNDGTHFMKELMNGRNEQQSIICIYIYIYELDAVPFTQIYVCS